MSRRVGRYLKRWLQDTMASWIWALGRRTNAVEGAIGPALNGVPAFQRPRATGIKVSECLFPGLS